MFGPRPPGRGSRALPALLLIGTIGCVDPRPAQDPTDWFDPGSDYDVMEPVEFTDQNYGFTGETAIADLPLPGPFETWFAPQDQPAPGCTDWTTVPELPAEITGIVTIMPRFYYKTSGCVPDDPTVDSDEKFYGSYFVQDASGGFFVLGDSKVAHFDMGDRVTLKVRATKESFAQYMIASHDVVEVERGPEPIYYQTVTGGLGDEHVSKVVRVEGTVATEASTFGEIYFDSDLGVRHKLSLDAELSRRGITYPVGTRIQATGPVLFSFDEYTVIVLRVGQITVIDG